MSNTKDLVEIRIGKTYYCNRSRIYEVLIDSGFTPIYTKPDFYDPSRTVWAFTKSPELMRCLNAYAEEHNSGVYFVDR